MQPFERLRRLARDSGPDNDDGDQWFVSEAADCLAGFAHDPAGLVVACRRLLVHHPAAGVLWWLCSRVLSAPNPSEAAWDACHLIEEDPTARRLGERLPFPHDEPVAVLGWPTLAGAALADRPDLDVVAVPRRVGGGRLRSHLTIAGSDARILPRAEVAAARPSHLLIEASAASPTETVVAAGADELLHQLAANGTVAILVAGVGRVIPERLLSALRRSLDTEDPDRAWDVVPVQRFDRVAGPDGLRDSSALARQVDCPVAPELLRIA